MEAAIRCYDPCISCSAHALGQMSLWVQLVSVAGEVIDEIKAWWLVARRAISACLLRVLWRREWDSNP